MYFSLLSYRRGNVTYHEVAEARWVSFEEAIQMLAFKSEREVVEKAREMIAK